MCYSVEPRTAKYLKKTIIEYCYKAGINASKKVIHKAAETTG